MRQRNRKTNIQLRLYNSVNNYTMFGFRKEAITKQRSAVANYERSLMLEIK